MKLEIATKRYRSKGSAQLISAASVAIDAGRAEWERTLTAVSTALIEDFGGEIAEDLGAEKSDGLILLSNADSTLTKYLAPHDVTVKRNEFKWVFDPLSPLIRAWIIKHGAESIKTILATNLDEVKRVILAGTDEHLSNAQISRSLRQFYTDRSPYKAMRIARTETNHAAGFGQREAAKQSGIVKTHTWITSRDDRVRDEHAAVDGETVAFGKPYSTGEMYPGEESINCRCVESFGTGR